MIYEALCWGRGKDTVPASVGQAAHQYNDLCWVGREVDSLVSCVLSTKNMLSCGLKDFVVHLLSVRSRR